MNKKAWYNTFNTVNTHSKNQKNFFVKIFSKKFHAFLIQIQVLIGNTKINYNCIGMYKSSVKTKINDFMQKVFQTKYYCLE